MLEEQDPKLLMLALRNVADATGGISALAEQTGLNRESLYKTLSPEGNPELATLLKIVRVLGLRLHATTAHA